MEISGIAAELRSSLADIERQISVLEDARDSLQSAIDYLS